jgi:hypothetical protein
LSENVDFFGCFILSAFAGQIRQAWLEAHSETKNRKLKNLHLQGKKQTSPGF